MLFGGSLMRCEDPCLHFWMPTGSLDFCQEWAQRQSCLWHRRTGEGQTRFDVEWWANIIQKMTFKLCPHAPETWEWECDLSYTQGQWQGKGSGWQLPVTVGGNAEPWRDCPSLPPDLFNKHHLPDPWMGSGTTSASPVAPSLWGGMSQSRRHPR